MTQHPLAGLFSIGSAEEEQEPHPLSPHAQAANLQAAWEFYTSPKEFLPGQLVKGRQGLGVLKTEPVLIFIRWLGDRQPLDDKMIEASISQLRWNKLDCVVAFCDGTATIGFHVYDSDLLEPYP